MSGKRDWLPPAALGVAAVVGTIPVLRLLIVPDLNWCYPFMSSDSYDWVANGLHWMGAPVESNWRPPGLPLVIGILWKLGALSLLPVVNYLVLGATTAILYLLLRERFTAAVSALSAWIFFANDYVQDLTKYVMSEIYGTLFIVLAAWLFFRAASRPRLYAWFGLALGVGFLFQYAALPAGIGFAAALLLTRRDQLRTPALWRGLAFAAVPPGAWFLLRWWHYHGAGVPQHVVETLLRFSVGNLRLYIVAGIALLGLALLPLYAAGFLRMVVGNTEGTRAFRATVFGPLVSLGLFWLFLYDWADKRFLYYVFPFCACFLAEGLAALSDWAKHGLVAKTIAAAYLAVALLWNQIRYPSYGINYIALTPRDFLECPTEQLVNFKTVLHLAGARVVRLHATIPSAFSRGLFDFRERDATCDVRSASYTCLSVIRKELDERLPSGSPIGLFRAQGFSEDLYAGHNRLGNELLRPVVWPEGADLVLTSEPHPEARLELECGPYRVYRRP
jgi:hypothetical protein